MAPFSSFNPPILINVASFTEAPLLGILANQLISKNESLIFVLPNYDENLISKIQSFMTVSKGLFIYLTDHNAEESQIEVDEEHFNNILSKYTQYDLDLNTFKALYLIQLRELEQSQKIIEQYKPKLLIVAEDGLSANCSLIHSALLANVPILDIPYGYGSYYDLENALAQKIKNNDCYTSEDGAGLAVKESYPKWINKGQYSGSILLNPYFILAREEVGITVKNPWTVHGGYATRLAAESKAMFEHYLSEGIESEKLILTGTPYCDYIRACLDSKINQALVRDTNPSILVCWPPSYHNERGDLCEFGSYHDLSASVFHFLSQLKSTKVTVSLHPAVQPEFREFVAGFNLNISETYILDELTKHDIYISCFSSTIRWAIALGKPVVNYDFYQFKINEYNNVPTMLNVDNQIAFENIVNRLVEEEQYYNEICLNQKKIAHKFGTLDSLNFERIYKVINDLTIESMAFV